MKKIYYFIGALNARNLLALLVILFLMASCAKSEIAQKDEIANASETTVPGEGDEPGQDTPENPDDPDAPESGDPSQPGGPTVPASDYISPDHFNVVQLELSACADVENASSETKISGWDGASDLEEFLEDEDTKTHLGDVVNKKQMIYWDEGDKLKIYYYHGASNYTEGVIKHGGSDSSTIDGWVNEEDDYYYAFYPYNADPAAGVVTTAVYDGQTYEGETYDKGAFVVTIPSEQDGQFAHCHMAVGKASREGRSFGFSNVGTYMKIEVDNTTATGITLQATDDTDHLVGQFIVPFTDKIGDDDVIGGIGEPVFVEGSGSSSVTVSLPSGRTGPVTVYVALLPNVEFTKGFRLRYEYGEKSTWSEAHHPGYAYVKRDGRTVDRRKILNVKTLDGRIRENYFVRTGGSYADADVAEAGVSWEKALNATGLTDLLAQPVDGSGDQIDYDAHDRAWMLDGATIHIAGGSYTLSDVKMECSGYGHLFQVAIKGGYSSSLTGTTTSVTRDTTTNRTIIAGDGSHRMMQLGKQVALSFDKIWFTGGNNTADSYCGGALLLAPGDLESNSLSCVDCCFKNNHTEGTNSNGGVVALLRNVVARFDNCLFFSNGTGDDQVGGNFYVWSNDCEAELHINGCSFANNHAGLWGGAIGISSGQLFINQEDNTRPTQFSTNYLTKTGATVRGGAIYAASGNVTARNCDFIGNYVPNGDNAGEGGAIAINGTATASFDNIRCSKHPTITRNMARNGAYLSLRTEAGYAVSFDNSSFTDGQVSNVGGALHVGESCSSEFNTCVFTNNHSSYCGGVIHINKVNASIELDDCIFTGNYNTGNGGGGVMSMENGTATFTECTFTANQARHTSGNGGGVFWLRKSSSSTVANLTVKGCTFTATDGGNKTLTTTAGAHEYDCANGGGILSAQFGNITFTSSDGTASGTRTTITGSSSASAGGAILAVRGSDALTLSLAYTDIASCSSTNYGGAIYTDAPVSLTNCTLNGNRATSAGAILMAGSASTLTMTDTDVTNNTTTSHAAGVRIEQGYPAASGTAVSVTGGTFSGNSASGYGAVFNFNETAEGAVKAIFTGVTFSNNTITNRGGVFHLNSNGTNREVTCTDCNFTGNQQTSTGNHGGGAIHITGGTLNLYGCNFTSNVSKGEPASDGEGGGAILTLGTKELHVNIDKSASTSRPEFKQNSAAGYGGAISHSNRHANSTIAINNVKFTQNESAYSGGALYHKNTQALSMNKVGFVQNKVKGTYDTLDEEHAGDAICYLGSSLTMNGSMGSNYMIGHTSTVPIHCPNVTALNFDKHEFHSNTTTLRNGCMISLTDTTDARKFTLSDCSIHDNKAPHGGAIYMVAKFTAGRISVSGTSFARNEATASDYGGKGGAIWWTCSTWDNSTGTPELYCTGCTFDGNKAGKAGSAIYLEKGRIQLRSGCEVINNTFSCPDNTWTSSSDHAGGAIMVDSINSKIDINGATISGNHSDGFGGGICMYGGRVFLTNVTFNDNYTHLRGGAIGQISVDGLLLLHRCSLSGNSTSGWGDALHINGGKTVIVNSTIYDGTSARSHATINGSPNLMMVNSTVVGNNSNPTIRVEGSKSGLLVNNIIINNGSGASLHGNGNYTWSSQGDYNIFGTLSYKSGVTDYYSAQIGDQTGKTSADLGSWAWNDAGYFTWNGEVNGTATATPAVDTKTSSNFTYDAMQNGFELSLTINDGAKLTWSTTNLGSIVRGTWCGDYDKDQRYTGTPRATAGHNFPGAYAN